MCNKIGIISKGNLVALDSTKNLIEKIQTKKVIFSLDKEINIEKIKMNSLKIISKDKNKLTISYEKSKLKIDEIISYLLKQDTKILDISTEDADIEDVYIELIKN